MKHKSHYDPSRDTVGKIYRDLHSKPRNHNDLIVVGDMTNEMMKGLVEDINDGIKSKPFGEQPWYIMIHEKKDLQMKEAFLRRVLHFKHRPYPEDDTTVFWHDPKAFETRFCWSLPHWSEMLNMIKSADLFDKDMINEILAWRRNDLAPFGFVKNDEGNWAANPRWKDKPIESFRKSIPA